MEGSYLFYVLIFLGTFAGIIVMNISPETRATQAIGVIIITLAAMIISVYCKINPQRTYLEITLIGIQIFFIIIASLVWEQIWEKINQPTGPESKSIEKRTRKKSPQEKTRKELFSLLKEDFSKS